MRRVKSHLLESLYIVGMIALIASVLIAGVSWIGRGTLSFISSSADTASRSVCKSLEGTPISGAAHTRWQGLAALPLESWPSHIGTLLQSGAAEDCAESYDADYAFFLKVVDATLQKAQRTLKQNGATRSMSKNGPQAQLTGLAPAWRPLGQWAISQGYSLLLRPARDIVADVSSLASIGGEILGVNDVVRALDINGLLAAIGGDEIVSNIQTELTSKMTEALNANQPAFSQVAVLPEPQMLATSAPRPMVGFVAALPMLISGADQATERLWLVLHVVQPDPRHPERLEIKRWLTRPL